MTKVLFTTPVLEHPPIGGPALRIENTIKALARVAEVHLVSGASTQEMGGPAAEEYYRGLCKGLSYFPPTAGHSSVPVIRKAESFLRSIGSVRLARNTRFLLDLVDEQGIDVVWFGYGNISFPLIESVKRTRPALKVVCDTDSVWSRFMLRGLPFETDARRRSRIERRGREKEREERAWVNLCEVTAAVSEVDAEYYRGLANEPDRVRIVSNVIDLETYRNVPAPADDLERPCLYLAGSFFPNSPMEDAARWTIDEVLPLIKAKVPSVRLYVVGRNSDEYLADIRDPGVIVEGEVPSVLPYLCHADVALVPLKFESGTRFKILEAGACRTPIVSTVLGAEGIPVTNERDILLADEPEAFAEAVVTLLLDRPRALELAENCHQLVSDLYSVEHLAREVGEILKDLAR